MSTEVSHNFPRAVRLGTTPQYSVLLISHGAPTRLYPALSILDRCCARFGADIAVAAALPADEVQELSRLYPGVRFIVAPESATSAELRMLGMQHVSGDIVVLQHDDAVTPAWADELKQRIRSLDA
jgi:hypothetical protein